MNFEGWGITPEGYKRPPLSVIKAQVETDMMTVFGADVIQTAQSPLGQLNGLMIDSITKLFEFAEQVYLSWDPDSAEGISLDVLARLRLISRSLDELDEDFRRAITNADRARVDVQDLIRAVRNIEGVTYAEVYLPEDGLLGEFTVPATSVAIAVTGGDDEALANVIRNYIVPGINTYGNHSINGEIEGRCRTFYIVRPTTVPVTLSVQIRLRKDRNGCAPPSTADVRAAIAAAYFQNGEDVSLFKLQTLVQTPFPGTVELVSFTGYRDGVMGGQFNPVEIGFFERASIPIENISVQAVA